jgi:LmbE family N-acetylglucosaminyl deacetylase
MDKKLAAMAAYESQFTWNKSPVPEMVKTLCGYFGGRIGTAYAEPFFTHETLGFSGIDQLV